MGTDEIAVLQGPYAPVDQEVVIHDLQVIGEVPKDLNGVYVRNGPNTRFQPKGRYHWFDGDGMMHAVHFDHGKVSYRNRWVATDCLEEELAVGEALWSGIKDPPRRDRPDMPLKNTSNTDVKYHAGKLVSMWYLSGDAYHLDPITLETLGKANFGGELEDTVSAHSRVDEHTGELLYFSYGKEFPYMSYGVIGLDGKLKHRIPIELPGPRLPHDMAITTNYTILHDLPLFYDMEAFKAGRHKLKFYQELPSRFAVVPRYGSVDQIRWFEAKPCYMYHVVNAWEEGDEVVMVGTPFRLPQDWSGKLDAQAFVKMVAYLQHDFMLYEWRFNLKTGETNERILDDVVNSEFPMINSAYQGKKSRYTYNVLMSRSRRPEEPRFSGLAKYDLETGVCQTYHEGPDTCYSEAPFAPADVSINEDDGYLVSFVWNARDQRSEVQVFDARKFGQGPVARVIIPQRVPNGFHSTWVSAKRLASGI